MCYSPNKKADVEIAYDMLWKDGVLIKIGRFGIDGKIYYWIKDYF